MAVIVNGDGILTGISSLATALTDLTSGRGTVTGVATVGTLQLGAGVSISSPRSQQAAIFTNNTEFFTVDDAGRVGVGTITPNSDAHPENEKKINVGFITARSIAGDIDANTMVVAGVSTFVGALNAGAVSGTTGTFTGDVTVTGTTPSILITDTDNNPDYLIKNGNGEFNIQDTTASANRLSINSSGNVVVGSDLIIPDKIVHASDTNTTIRFPEADTVSVETGGSERLRINSDGRLIIGTTASVDVASGAAAMLQVEHAGSNLSAALYSTIDAIGPAGVLALGHARGSATGVLQADDVMGQIRFAGGDGTDLETPGAQISAEVDGTPGSNDMPGRLVFETTADGASSTTERMRIGSNGKIHMNYTDGNGADRLNIMGGGDGITIARSTSNASDGNILGNISFHSYMNGSYHANAEAKIEAIADSGQSGSNAPTHLDFYTKKSGVGPGASPAHQVRFHSNGNVKIFDGDLIIGTSGHGIDFSETSNSAGTTSEIFDDYEEGTFTPVYQNGSGSLTVNGSYSTQSGHYVKIGDFVYVEGGLRANVTNNSNGTFDMGGLPYTAANTTDSSGIIHCKEQNNWTVAPHHFSVMGNTTSARARGGIDTGDASYTNGNTNFFNSGSTNNNRIYFAGHYRAA